MYALQNKKLECYPLNCHIQSLVLFHFFKFEDYNPPSSSVSLDVLIPRNLSVLSGGTVIL